MRWIIRLVCQALVLLSIAHLQPEWIALSSFWGALAAMLLVSLFNLLVRPLLFILRLLTTPLSCLTLGLFSLALSLAANVLVIWIADLLLAGFKVQGGWALLGTALILSVSNTVLNLILHRERRGQAQGEARG